MRLAVVLAAAVVVVVVVSAAPPSPMRPPSPHSAPLLRPKRGNTPPKSATIPYSNYRRVSGVHRPYSAWKQLASVRRYRYPLYRKRNYPQHYDYEDEVFLPEEEVEEEYPSYAPRPSLFRERNMKEEEAIAAMEEAERRENDLMLNQGYFHELPDEDVAGYDYTAPYVLSYPELEKLNRLYDMEETSDEDFPVYAPSRKTMAPTATGRFYDALSYVRKRATEMKPEEPLGMDAATPPRAKKPQQYLTSAAGRYWRVRDEQQQQEAQEKAASSPSAVRDPDMMIRKRKKRNTTTATTTTATTTPPAGKRRKTNTPSTTITTKPKTHAPTTTTTTTTTTTAPHRDHRNKRAFSDYFKWEKRGEEQQQQQEEEEEEEGEEEEEDNNVDDYLTREYFKTIARSVGQKRMAYGQFEPDTEDKRSSSVSVQDILSNPETLRMVQDQLREAEAVMAKEAGTGLSEWPHGGTQDEAAQKLLSTLILRMDAIEHMREVLAQLQHLQEARTGARVGGRREIQLRDEERKRAAAAEQGEWRERSMAARGNQKRSVRRRLRREDIGDLFMGNEKEECPVLWWILESCSTVSEKVGDESQVFLPACIKHEICYVCGASQGISGHECDAVLSSALEASCPARSLDCLAAAGSTFSSLSRPAAYDPAGSCANDPCVIHFLEAR